MKEKVKKLIPDMIFFGHITDSKIEKAIKKFKSRRNKIKHNGNKNLRPHCVFDIIELAEIGDINSLSFLSFINQQTKELFGRTDLVLHPKIRSIVSELILTLDTDIDLPNNPSYLNYTAEICGLNHILNVVDGRYILKEIEKKLPNGKQADFIFYDNENKELLYVDFVSIHNIDISKLTCNEDLINILEKRFNDKLQSKTKNLNDDFDKIEIKEGVFVNFAILPIIWTEISDFIPFFDVFNIIEHKYTNVFPCCSLLPQTLDDKTINYSFTKVCYILERWNEIEKTDER